MTRWKGKSNECVYERCGMGPCANGVKCGVLEWMRTNKLKRFGHMERKKSEEFVKEMHMSETEGGPMRKGRPLLRLKNSEEVLKCMEELLIVGEGLN